VIFESLEREDIHKIIDIELSHLYDRVRTMGYEITVTPAAKDYIAEKGWDSQFGARPLKRAIQKYVEDNLAEEIIKTKLAIGDVIKVDFIAEKEEILVTITKPSAVTESAKPETISEQ